METKVTYLIREGERGPTKIGMTTLRGLEMRRRQLQQGNPTELVLVRVFDGDYELALHAEMADHRIRGEWFDLSDEQLAAMTGAFVAGAWARYAARLEAV